MTEKQKATRWYMQVKGSVPIIYERGAGQRFPVAVVEPLYEHDSGEERQARGRLIAKAPEMMEMLKQVEWGDDDKCLFCFHWGSEGHPPDCEWQALINDIDGTQES